jgi:hypothetical protein
MPQSFTTEALQTLFIYPFKAPDWKNKFLIGSLVTLAGFVVPVLPSTFLYGYIVQIMRRIIVEGGEPYLPEWDDWDKLFKDGLKLVGVTFIYSLPMILILLVGYGLFFVATFVPLILVEAGNDESAATFLALTSMGGTLAGLTLFGLGMILALITFAFLPVAIGHMIATDDFGAAFRLAELWAIFRANVAGFLMSFALLLGFWMALSFVIQILFLTIIFCCIYPFVFAPLTMYMMVVWSVMFAQAYRDAVQKLRSQPVSLPTLS